MPAYLTRRIVWRTLLRRDTGYARMRVGDTVGSDLVAAARAGDHQAMNDLVSATLPLVYTLVRRALPDDPEVDDVVQDVMLRAVRQLPLLREPESFRAWLTAIAVNQIGTRLRRRIAQYQPPLRIVVGGRLRHSCRPVTKCVKPLLTMPLEAGLSLCPP